MKNERGYEVQAIRTYPLMIVGVYATLGLFLIMAARNPLNHLSLIW